MSENKFLNIAKDLKRRTVLISDSGERLGEVSDVIIHPTKGKMLGIEIENPDHQLGFLEAVHFTIGPDAVMAKKTIHFQESRTEENFGGGVRALKDLIGTNVVTDQGKLIGKVSEVYTSLDGSSAVFHVAESTLQRFLGRGFYMAGDIPNAYSSDGVRLIVPSDTEDRAGSSISEAVSEKSMADVRESKP